MTTVTSARESSTSKNPALIDQIKALVDEGLSRPQIADRLGMKPHQIEWYTKAYGIKMKASVPIDRDALAALMAEGKDLRQIAGVLGRSYDSTRSAARRYGLSGSAKRGPKPIEIDPEKLRAYVAEGRSVPEMARALYVGVDTVRARLQDLDLAAGVSPPLPQLSPAFEDEREAMIRAGLSLREIARRQGVSPQAVHQWALRKGLPIPPKAAAPATNYGRVAKIARAALAENQSPSAAVAHAFRVSAETARVLITRARQNGFYIPYSRLKEAA